MFVTIPTPSPVYRRFKGHKTEHQKLYLEPGDKGIIQAAAAKCGISYGDYIRQCALNVATAIGVSNNGNGDHQG